VPLQLDRDEGVARKQRRPELDPTSVTDAPIPQPWVIRLVTGQGQTMQRQALAMWLEADGAPIGHSSHRPERIAVPAAGSRILGADRRAIGELAGPPTSHRSPRLPNSWIGRRVEVGTP
jgi:hypothetical protein